MTTKSTTIDGVKYNIDMSDDTIIIKKGRKAILRVMLMHKVVFYEKRSGNSWFGGYSKDDMKTTAAKLLQEYVENERYIKAMFNNRQKVVDLV